MYNIVMGGQHPSTVCVEISKLPESLKSLRTIINSEFMKDEMMEFINEFARTEEIMPDDRTLGFIIVNSDKLVLSISMSQTDPDLGKTLRDISDEYRRAGFRVDLDLP